MTNIGKEIIDFAHKQGIRFTFDSECDVIKDGVRCKNIAEWAQDITHQTEGKMKLDLCQKHLDDFDKDICFDVILKEAEN